MSALAKAIRDAAWTHGNALRSEETAAKVAQEIVEEFAPTDDEIRALVRAVAQATVEFAAEEYESDSGFHVAELWAERRQVADRMADVFMESAEELPDSEFHALRRMRT